MPRKNKSAEGESKDRDSIGWRLRSARLALAADRGENFSQQEFAQSVADRLGVSFHQTRLSRIEKNTSVPTIYEALACADVAGEAVTWLAFGIAVSDWALDDLLAAQRAWLATHRPGPGRS